MAETGNGQTGGWDRKIADKIVAGNACFERNQPVEGEGLLLEAWHAAPQDIQVVKAVTATLVAYGCQESAFQVLEYYVARGVADSALLSLMAQMASGLEAHDVAAQFLLKAASAEPGNPSHLVNLAYSWHRAGQSDQAIALLQEAIPKFPDYAGLWNVLGTVANEYLHDTLKAREFYLEAYRLAPRDFQIVNNLANMFHYQEEGRDWAEKAIALSPEAPEPHVGLAFILMGEGRLREAWPHYEYRLAKGTSGRPVVRYGFDLPLWQGGSLAGKTIFIAPEQGIGDEVLFALNFDRVIGEARKVYVGCDPRLVSIFARSFPAATVVAFEDTRRGDYCWRKFPALGRADLEAIDAYVPAGSLPRHYWSSVADIPARPEGFLVPDAERVAAFREAMKGEGRLKVGLSWRSGLLARGRDAAYMAAEDLVPLFALPGIDFYSLQYDCVAPEKAVLKAAAGDRLHFFEDVDLKADIEANLAIMANLDLVIGPGVATQMFAIAVGRPTWYVTRGKPWWAFTSEEKGHAPFAPQCRWFVSKSQGWQPLIGEIGSALAGLVPPGA